MRTKKIKMTKRQAQELREASTFVEECDLRVRFGLMKAPAFIPRQDFLRPRL